MFKLRYTVSLLYCVGGWVLHMSLVLVGRGSILVGVKASNT